MTLKLGFGCFAAAALLWWVGGSLHGARLLAGGLLLCAYGFVEMSVKARERKLNERLERQQPARKSWPTRAPWRSRPEREYD